MNEVLTRYLEQSYRRDILGESVEIPAVPADPETIARVKAALAKINALKLGASLAQRDFAAYQQKQSLEKLLKELEGTP